MMEELDVLKRAQFYVEQMANGVNPLTGEIIDENDFVNNVRISRCLFFVNEKLKELIDNGGEVGAKKRRAKEKFVFNKDKIDAINTEDRAICLSEIIRNVKKAYDDRCRLTYADVASILQEKGLLIANDGAGPKLVASPQAEQFGIRSELVHGRDGDYYRTLYDLRGQKLVLSLLEELNDR